MMSRVRGDEQGSALVETAIVLSLLMVLAIGAFEWGMAFRDWLSVSSATREGARVAASAGRVSDADCAILEATAGSLLSIDQAQIAKVDIYQADSSGNVSGPYQQYRPRIPDDPESSLICGNWIRIINGYQPANRDNQGADRDWIGVRLEFTHSWKTGLFWWSGGVTWSDRTIILMEPDPTI